MPKRISLGAVGLECIKGESMTHSRKQGNPLVVSLSEVNRRFLFDVDVLRFDHFCECWQWKNNQA